MSLVCALTEIERDADTAMHLAVDRSDPPRYYMVERERRRELLAIGDRLLARQAFDNRVAKLKRRIAVSGEARARSVRRTLLRSHP